MLNNVNVLKVGDILSCRHDCNLGQLISSSLPFNQMRSCWKLLLHAIVVVVLSWERIIVYNGNFAVSANNLELLKCTVVQQQMLTWLITWGLSVTCSWCNVTLRDELIGRMRSSSRFPPDSMAISKNSTKLWVEHTQDYKYLQKMYTVSPRSIWSLNSHLQTCNCHCVVSSINFSLY